MSTVEPAGHRLPRSARVRRSGDIRAVLRSGVRKRTSVLDVYALATAHGRPRVGWVVPMMGQGAVARNRLKRRLREIGRLEVLPRMWGRGSGVDVLVRARRRAYGATYRQLADAWTRALELLPK